MCKKWSVIFVISKFFADKCSQTSFPRQLPITDRYLQRCMNKENITYRSLLFENGPNINEICENYKTTFNTHSRKCTKCAKSNFPTSQKKTCTEEAQS